MSSYESVLFWFPRHSNGFGGARMEARQEEVLVIADLSKGLEAESLFDRQIGWPVANSPAC